MALSVSDAVVEILEGMQFLKAPMALDLINYSALARAIKPQVEKRMNGPVELETIIMAIRRNEHLMAVKQNPAVFDVLRECKIDLATGLGYAKFKRNQEVAQQVFDFVKNANAEQLEQIYVIQRADEVAVVVPEQLLAKLEKLPMLKKNPSLLLEKKRELAAVTVRLPAFTIKVPGVFALLATEIADSGISLLTALGSFGKSAFIVEEKDAPTAYARLNKLISESKKIAELNR